MDKLPATGIERRELACGTCHKSLAICPECGLRLAFHPNKSQIVCKSCNVELVKTGKIETPGDMMGFDGYYISPVYSCPKCSLKWSPKTHEQPETIYVDHLL